MNDVTHLQEQIEQYRFFVTLDDQLRALVDIDDIALTAVTALGRHLGASHCLYADITDASGTTRVVGNYASGAPLVMDAAGLCLPLRQDGRAVACIVVYPPGPRDWTTLEIALLDGAARRCRESIERSRVTRGLWTSEAHWHTIADAMPQIVWTTDPGGTVDYWNERMYQYVGLAPGSQDGAAWAELVHPDDRAAAGQAWAASIAGGESYETTYRLRHHDGDWRWSLARALPLRDDTGRIIKWLGTNTDIDAQKRSEQALQEVNRRKDEFLAMLSHELRNPLAPISAAADLLLAGVPGGEASAAHARALRAGTIIQRQVRHLTSLVDDLLDAARVTQGLAMLNTARLDLHQVVADAAEQVRPLVAERRHALALRLPPHPVHVLGDHQRLVQVLVNLLNNAAKYTPHGGRIEVEMGTDGADGDQVQLLVRDNGVGMTAELTASAFDLFHQGERAKDRGQGGLGIGLALVKSLVEQHGGRVLARSAGPGRGSLFTVQLPRAAGPDAVAPSAAPALPDARRRRILVVDDNADAAQMVAMLLEVLGHEVAIEYDPLQALASLRERSFDAYILDIGLPGMDGHELARQIRKLPAAQKALFIALTGYGQEGDRQASYAAGFHHHFVKPANIDALSRALEVESA